MKLAPMFFSGILAVLALGGCQTEPKPAPTGGPVTQSTTPPAPNPNDVAGRTFQLRNLAVQDITANGHVIHAWVMDTEPKRQEGMMFLKDPNVKDDQGMLFVFKVEQGPLNGFWMHNTILPLDIIYIDAAGKVLNVQKGKPFDETSLPAKGDYLFTLELKQGQAEKLDIKAGSTVVIPESISAQE